LSASIVCPACGATNSPTHTFCINCGIRLPAAPVPPGVPPPGVPSPPPAAYPAPGAYPYPTAYPYYGVPPRTATFSEILSGTFQVWTKNFVNFFIVYLALAAVTTLLGVALGFALFGVLVSAGGLIPGGGAPTGASLVTLLVFAIGALVISVIVTSVVNGGMTEYAVRRFRGEPMTIQQALRRGFDRFLSILGANVLLTLIVFALVLLPILLIIPILLLGSGNAGFLIAAICGLLLALIIGGTIAIWVYVSMSLYAPAVMMENARAVDSLKRSWTITKGHRWSIFGAILIAQILAVVISVAITFPAGLARNTVVSLAASIIASALVGPWLAILAAVAYDLIVRAPAPAYAPPPYTPPYYPYAPQPYAPPAAPPPPQEPPPANPPPNP